MPGLSSTQTIPENVGHGTNKLQIFSPEARHIWAICR